MTVPIWAQDSIFYQIFPDRFENGDHSNDPANLRPWKSLPDSVHFHGGDLQGIIKRLDYLYDLGFNAIYLNPIFLSPSNHRYNTVDYYQIDPKLGTLADFKMLVSEIHKKGMRIILDGVFNHCGRGFFAFNDVLENTRESPYKDWFHIHRYPLHAYSSSKSRNYQAWWGFKSLPKFNTDNPQVRNYIYDVARHWIELGADGWRLDVPNEIDDDSFWAEFRNVVKGTNSEALLIGEIWDIQPRWVGDNHFDGLMNYPFRTAILDLLANGNSGALFAESIRKTASAYSQENLLSMYNLLGSHDTERIKTLLSGRENALRLAFLILIALPGAPAIYYGDEIGLEGGKDPDCRRTFPWDKDKWDQDLQNWVKNLIQQRKSHAALRSGKMDFIYASETEPVLGFSRSFGGEKILIIVNGADNNQILELVPETLPLSTEGNHQDLLGQSISAHVQNNKLLIDMPANSGAYFKIS
jgi:cyclomaltodextrinase